jgi:hypothetical protein
MKGRAMFEDIEEPEGCVDCGSEASHATCAVRRETLCERCWHEEILALPTLPTISETWRYLASGRVASRVHAGPSIIAEAEGVTITQALERAQALAWEPLIALIGAELVAYHQSLTAPHVGPGLAKATDERHINEAAHSRAQSARG